jgi:hypothetical protein
MPPELGETGFDEIWRQCGGYHPDLLPLPADDRLRFEKLVQWASEKPFAMYSPKLWGR